MKVERKNMIMLEETKWMRNLLPDHYICKPLKNGVHCYSSTEEGIDENDPEHFEFIHKAIKQKYKKRFMEIFHQTCTDHLKFTVYIRPL